jgi:hypothetical protein
MSAVAGAPIEHVDVTEAEARARFLADGFPPEFADFVLCHFAAVKAGKMITTRGVEDLLGRPAATFDNYLQRNTTALKTFVQQST